MIDTKNSEFFHFGILPELCIHTLEEDEYSKMYIPQEKCDCGSSEWFESTMILGTYPCGTHVIKDVNRCSQCNNVRMARHIGLKD